MQLAQPVGHLAVDAHRVDEPRDADDAGVRRDHEDRRREQADVQLAGALERSQVHVLDDPEHRVAGVAALLLADSEQRLVAAVGLLRHRQRAAARRPAAARRSRRPRCTTRLIARGIVVASSLASSAMFEIVSMPV